MQKQSNYLNRAHFTSYTRFSLIPFFNLRHRISAIENFDKNPQKRLAARAKSAVSKCSFLRLNFTAAFSDTSLIPQRAGVTLQIGS